MNIAECIKRLQRIQSTHGNLEVFVLNERYQPSELMRLEVADCDDGDFPKEWCIPKKYVSISD